LKKYDKKNFQIEVLEYCDDEKILNDREIYHISNKLPEYNIARGGNGGDTLHNALKEYKNKIINKRKQTLSNTWNTISEERKKAWGESISKGKKGKYYDRLNYKHSEETKRKISESNREWKKDNLEWKINHAKAMEKRKGIPNKKCFKKVKVDGIVYDSMKEACEKLNTSFPTLKKWIKKGIAHYE
jgi:group I intron endonuclease